MVLIIDVAHLRFRVFKGLVCPGSIAMYCTLRGFVMGEGAEGGHRGQHLGRESRCFG